MTEPFELGSTLHMAPRNDLVGHDTSTDEPTCVCGPSHEPMFDQGTGFCQRLPDHSPSTGWTEMSSNPDVEPIPSAEPALPTYETYFHGEKLVQCGGCGKQVLQVLHSCKGIPAPQSSPAPLLPLSAPVETEGQVEGRTEALKAHWYPVVDDTIGGWAISSVDLPVSQLDTRGRKHFTVGDFLTEEIARHLCELHNSTLSSPLPADEVEPDAMQWGYREHPAEYVDPVREEYARFRAADDHLTLVKREVRYGPWVAVPVEPKETNQ